MSRQHPILCKECQLPIWFGCKCGAELMIVVDENGEKLSDGGWYKKEK